jgi:hypothetical protein
MDTLCGRIESFNVGLIPLHGTFNSSHDASNGALYDQEYIYRDYTINTWAKVCTETPVYQ